MSIRARLPLILLCASGVLAAARAGRAQSSDADGPAPGDRISWRAGYESYLQLFERAAFFGPSGALVRKEVHAPLHDTALLRVDDIDAPWRADSVDVELSAWGMVDPGETGPVRRVDGDLAVASVRQRLGPASITLGRQLRVGGAARFTRLDGAAASLALPGGLGVEAYGGLRVLPRWSERPGHQLLGSVADSMARDPAAVEPPSRGEEWALGGRARLARARLGEAGLSLHEERHAGEIGRRELGLDLAGTPVDALAMRALGLLDLDSLRPSEARVAVDVSPIESLAVGAEAQHATPALLLSRQSVLSVFSTGAFDEVGGTAEWRPILALALRGAAYADFFEDSRAGGRGHAELRIEPERRSGLGVSLRYGRVVEPENGYTSLRLAAWASPLASRLFVRGEAWSYLYDHAIAGVSHALVGAGTVGWAFGPSVRLDAGGSIARSPLSALDAQAVLRLSLAHEGSAR